MDHMLWRYFFNVYSKINPNNLFFACGWLSSCAQNHTLTKKSAKTQYKPCFYVCNGTYDNATFVVDNMFGDTSSIFTPK